MEPLESFCIDAQVGASPGGSAEEDTAVAPHTCPLCGSALVACPVGADKRILLCSDPSCIFPLDQPDLTSFVLPQHSPATTSDDTVPEANESSSNANRTPSPAPSSMLEMLRRAAQTPRSAQRRRTPTPTQPPRAVALPTPPLQPMQPLSFSSLSFT